VIKSPQKYLCLLLCLIIVLCPASVLTDWTDNNQINQAKGSPFISNYCSSTLWSGISDFDIEGDYAYCFSPHGLIVLDVSDKSDPTFVSKSEIDFEGQHMVYLNMHVGIDADGDYVYVSWPKWTQKTTGWFYVFDVSTPESPELIARIENPFWSYGLQVSSDHAFLNIYRGLMVINISDPHNPTPVYTYNGGINWTRALAVDGNYLYSAYHRSLEVYDITYPQCPPLVGYCDFIEGGEPIQFVIRDNYAYISGGGDLDGLRIVDISDPTNPHEEGKLVDMNPFGSDVALNGDYAYLLDDLYGIFIIDISNPADPFLAATYDMESYDVQKIIVEGNYAYLSFPHGPGFWILDVTNPVAPILVGEYNTPGRLQKIDYHDDYVYATTGISGGLQIVDVSDPSATAVIGGKTTGGYGYCVSSNGNYALVGSNYAARYGGLHIFDVTDPTAPVLTDSLLLGPPGSNSYIWDIDIMDNLACVAINNGVVKLFDFSDPYNLTLLDTLYIIVDPNGIDIQDSLAYVGTSSGYRIIDISDPYHIELVGTYQGPGINEVDVVDSMLYCITSDDVGLLIYDINDLEALSFVGNYAFDGGLDVRVQGNYAYIGSAEECLLVLDISDPATPTYVCEFPLPEFDCGVRVNGNYIYVSNWYGLVTLETLLPGAIEGNILYTNNGLPADSAIISAYSGVARIAADTADLTGNYIIEDIPPGSYTLKCSKPGYFGDSSGAIEVFSDQSAFADMDIQPFSENKLFGPPVEITGVGFKDCIMAAYLNADSAIDLVLSSSGYFSIYINDGTGEFTETGSYSYASGDFATNAADLDLDGDNDIVVGVEQRLGFVLVYYNNGDATFSEPTPLYMQDNPGAVCAVDLNNDNYPDIASFNQYVSVGADSIAVFLNNGDGSFGAYVNYGTPSPVDYIISRDFDHDNNSDLAVLGDEISIRLNNGDGTLADPVIVGANYIPEHFVAADLNGDSYDDLAIVNHFHNVTILLNLGNGSFSEPVVYDVGKYPVSICAADYDLDGDVDLAVANESSNDFTVLLNDGAAVFAQTTLPSDLNRPGPLCTADFDNNDVCDLAVSNNSVFHLTIHFGIGPFVCGDANGDLGVNILDITFLINYLYKGGPAPQPEQSADADGNTNINILDVTYLINYLYKGGGDPIC